MTEREINNLALPKGTVIPNHIAMILDGNRRWARARGLDTFKGHQAGFKACRRVVRTARDFGVHTFTIWAFSTENRSRSKKEVSYLMQLFAKLLRNFLQEVKKEKIRVVHLGKKDNLPKTLVDLFQEVQEETRRNDRHILNIALDYGGRDEILRAVKKIIMDKVEADLISEELFSKYLDTGGQPYPNPDLLIRPSGEQRTSGFMPWQIVYSEYYYEEDHLPDFSPEKFRAVILDYSRRRRRFGGNDALKHFAFNPKITANFELAWWKLSQAPQGKRFTEYLRRHIGEQWSLSKGIAGQAAPFMVEAVIAGNSNRWIEAQNKLEAFYQLLKDEVKLAFEPSVLASLEINLMKKIRQQEITLASEIEELSRNFLAELYRISELQAAKPAHLRTLAMIERILAEKGLGAEHWEKAEDYLQKYYQALKERVA